MKNIIAKASMILFVMLAIFCLSACSGEKNEISVEEAQAVLEDYLTTKGFVEGKDFLSEPMVMQIDGENFYSFSWRVESGDHADKLFGTYAVSFDGTEFYEYQAGRDDWIKCIKSD